MKLETNPRMARIAYYTETTNLLGKRAVVKRTGSAINGRFVTQEYAKNILKQQLRNSMTSTPIQLGNG